MSIKSLSRTLLPALLWLLAGCGSSQADTFKEGEHYQILNPPQTTTAPAGKIEVVEVFSYACPHCHHFEPFIESWVKEHADKVSFVRLPAIFSQRWEIMARAYYTAEVLGVLDKVHTDIFQAIHERKQNLGSESALQAYFATFGVAQKKFQQAFNSFAVNSKMRYARQQAKAYGIRSTPTLIINGKYRVAPKRGIDFKKLLQIADYLLTKSS